MNETNIHHRLHEKFASLVALAGRMEKTPKTFGTNELLSSSEIHLVEIIGDHDEQNGVTELARLLAVTKGAVSQNVKRLEKKGLCVKAPDPENGSRSMIRLTSKGKTAYYAHKHWHETMDGGFKKYFESLTEEQNRFLLETLERLEDFMKRVLGEAAGSGKSNEPPKDKQ